MDWLVNKDSESVSRGQLWALWNFAKSRWQLYSSSSSISSRSVSYSHTSSFQFTRIFSIWLFSLFTNPMIENTHKLHLCNISPWIISNHSIFFIPFGSWYSSLWNILNMISQLFTNNIGNVMVEHDITQISLQTPNIMIIICRFILIWSLDNFRKSPRDLLLTN